MTLRVAVAGASGFMGSSIVAALAERGVEVLAMSRRRPARLPLGAVWTPWTHVLDANSGRNADRSVDAVVNAVASRQHRSFPGGVPDLLEANVAATARLLVWARACEAATVVQLSTGSVYGPGEAHREDAAARPAAFWAATRCAAEQLAIAAGDDFEQVHVTRLYFPYGPGQQDRLIPNLAKRIRVGEPVELVGDGGGMTLSPTFVGDAAGLISDLCDSSSDAARSVPGPVSALNVAGPETISIEQLAEHIGHAIGCTPTYVRLRHETAVTIVPDLERLHRVRPADRWTSLSDGLHRTFA